MTKYDYKIQPIILDDIVQYDKKNIIPIIIGLMILCRMIMNMLYHKLILVNGLIYLNPEQ